MVETARDVVQLRSTRVQRRLRLLRAGDSPIGVFEPGIERQHILERCLDATQNGVILIEAPAGFGKTYVLAQLRQQALRSKQTVAWVNLQPADTDPAVLACHLLDSLRCCAVQNLPNNPMGGALDSDQEQRRFVTALTHGILKYRRRVLLILDDYQTVENGCVNELLSTLLGHMPVNLSIALAGRRTCPLALSRLLLQGRLHRIDHESLLFSKKETRTYFGRSIGPAQLSRLHILTEGWPAALKMAMLCLNERFGKSVNVTDNPEFARLMGAYCASEILRGADTQAVDLLIDCSIVETLEPDLCNAIRHRKDSAQILARLTAQETFLEPVNAQRNTWRIPRLLRHALLRCAAERGSDPVAAANLRAAEYFAISGRIQLALRHYIEGGDPAAAAAILEDAAPLVILAARGDEKTRELLDLIPRKQMEDFPRLGLCQVLLDYKQGLMEEARINMAALAVRTGNFTADRPGGNASQLKIDSMCVASMMDFYARSKVPLEYLRTLQQTLATVTKIDARLAVILHVIIGELYKLRGDFEASESHFIQCDKLQLREPAPWETVWRKYQSGALALARGNISDAKYHFYAGLKLRRTDFPASSHVYSAIVRLALAEIDYEADSLTEAQAKLDDGLYVVQHIEGWFEIYAALYETAMMIHWHAGRIDQVESLLAHAVAIKRVAVLIEGFLVALRLRFELLRGRFEAAQNIVDTHDFHARWAAPTFQEEFSYREWDLLAVCLCLLAIHKKEFSTADRIVNRLDQVARLAGRGRMIVKASVLKAIIAHQQAEQEQATLHLVRALEAGHTHGYRRVFLDEAALIRPILADVQNRLASTPIHLVSYAHSLSKALLKTGKEGGTDEASTLSERELDVLRELSLGHSNKLIARKLGVSAPTVKFHVRNVFRKLGVRRRASAVAQAHQRGLLC